MEVRLQGDQCTNDCVEWISIQFNITQDNHLGYITPHWVDKPNDVFENLQHGVTNILQEDVTNIWVPFSSDEMYAIVQQRLNDIKLETLLFLRKVKIIQITEGKTVKTVECVESDQYNSTLVHTINNGNEEISEKLHYKIYKETFRVPTEMTPYRKGVEKTEIILAFDTSGNAPRSQNSFAFLPMNDFGFPFILQADFKLVTSRDSPVANNKWNKWIVDLIPKVFINSLDLFKSDLKSMKIWYRSIPHYVQDAFFAGVADQIRLEIPKVSCIWTRNEQLKKPSDVFLSDEDIEDLIPSQLIEDTLRKEFVHPKLEFASELKSLLKTCSFDDVYRIIQNESWISQQIDAWFYKLYLYLAKNALNSSRIDGLKRLKLIRLENGQHVIPSGGIYLPEKVTLEFASFKDLDFVKFSTVTSNSKHVDHRIEEFMEKLSIESLNESNIIEHYILPKYSSFVDKKIHLSHITFLRDKWSGLSKEIKQKLKDKLKLYTIDGKFLKPDEVYRSKVYSKDHEPDLQFLGDSKLLNKYYVETSLEESEFTRLCIFLAELGVSSFPSVERGKSVDFEKMIEEYTYHALNLIDFYWVRYYSLHALTEKKRVSNMMENLKRIEVKASNGEVHQIQNLYYNREMSLNFKDWPFLALEIKNPDFVVLLDLTQDFTSPMTYVKRLRELSSSKASSERLYHQTLQILTHLVDLYFNKPVDNKLREILTSEPLLFIVDKKFKSTQLFWEQDETIFKADLVTPMSSLFPRHDSEKYKKFCLSIGVLKERSMKDCIPMLEKLDGKLTKTQMETLLAIYSKMDKILEDKISMDWLSKDAKIVWSSLGMKKVSDKVYLNDDDEISKVFRSKIPIFDVDKEYHAKFPNLFEHFNMQSLGANLKVTLLNKHSSLEETLTKVVKSKIPYIEKYLYNSDIYIFEEHKSLFAKLRDISVYSVTGKVETTLTIQGISEKVSSNVKFVDEGNNCSIYVNGGLKTDKNALISIILVEISRIFNILKKNDFKTFLFAIFFNAEQYLKIIDFKDVPQATSNEMYHDHLLENVKSDEEEDHVVLHNHQLYEEFAQKKPEIKPEAAPIGAQSSQHQSGSMYSNEMTSRPFTTFGEPKWEGKQIERDQQLEYEWKFSNATDEEHKQEIDETGMKIAMEYERKRLSNHYNGMEIKIFDGNLTSMDNVCVFDVSSQEKVRIALKLHPHLANAIKSVTNITKTSKTALGFDILSIGPKSHTFERCIELKTSSIEKSHAEISRYEWMVADSLRSSYYIYFIENVFDKNKIFGTEIPNPCVLPKEELTYRIFLKARSQGKSINVKDLRVDHSFSGFDARRNEEPQKKMEDKKIEQVKKVSIPQTIVKEEPKVVPKKTEEKSVKVTPIIPKEQPKEVKHVSNARIVKDPKTNISKPIEKSNQPIMEVKKEINPTQPSPQVNTVQPNPQKQMPVSQQAISKPKIEFLSFAKGLSLIGLTIVYDDDEREGLVKIETPGFGGKHVKIEPDECHNFLPGKNQRVKIEVKSNQGHKVFYLLERNVGMNVKTEKKVEIPKTTQPEISGPTAELVEIKEWNGGLGEGMVYWKGYFIKFALYECIGFIPRNGMKVLLTIDKNLYKRLEKPN